MKLRNVFVMGLVALGVAAAFSSCKKDPTIPGPTINFYNESNQAIKSWDGVSPVVLIVKVDEKTSLDKITYILNYTQDGNTKSSPEKNVNFRKVEEMKGYVATIKPGAAPAAEGTMVVIALDKNGSESKAELKWIKTATDNGDDTPAPAPEQPQGPEARGWVGAPRTGGFSHAQGEGKGGFDLKNGVAVSLAGKNKAPSASIYIMHKSDDSKEFKTSFTSTGNKYVSTEGVTGNNTKFAAVTLNFETATAAECKEKFESATPSETQENVKVGNIYIAKKDNEMYLIKITKVDPANNSTRSGKGGKGSIEFQYYTAK